MKKLLSRILALVIIIAVCMTFFACNDKDNGEIELVMWAGGQWTGTDYENLQNFIANFNDTNELGFTIKLQFKSNMELDFVAARSRGTTPDILIWDRFNTPTYSDSNMLQSIDHLIERDNIDISVYHIEAMSEMIYKGSTYGLPIDLDTWGIYVNMDMVDAYNESNPNSQIVLDNDWTWHEMLDIAKKLTVKTGTRMDIAGYSANDLHEHFFKYMVSTGQEFIVDGKTNFLNDEAEDVLKFFRTIKDADVCRSGMTEDSAFVTGLLAMYNKPTYYSDYIRQYNPNMNYKFMPQPRYDKENGTVPTGSINGGMIGGFGLAYPQPRDRYKTEKWEQRLDYAWEFTKWWLTNDENMLAWGELSNTLPAKTSLYDSDFVQNSPALKQASEFVVHYKIRPQIPGFLFLQTEVINPTVSGFLDGRLTLSQTLNDLTGNGDYKISED